MTISTWDPANKGTHMVLSGGNLIATQTGTGTGAMVLTNTSKSTGKLYAEVVITQNTTAGSSTQIGFAQNNQNVEQFIGFSGDDGWVRADMSTFDGGAEGIVTYTTANRGFTTATTGDVIGLALDFGAGKAWISKNNTFGGNPVAGTSPAYTWSPAGSWLIAVWSFCGGENPAETIHTDSTNQTYTAPSGFTPWDGAGGGGGTPSTHRMLTLGVG